MSRITVINDQREFLDLIEEVMDGAGHEVRCLEEVKSDIDEVAAGRPDLLIVDLRLHAGDGRLSGWELLLLARSDARLADVPIVVCSADRDGIERRRDEMQAMSDVHLLHKPFALEELEELVARLLERMPATPDPHPAQGDRPAASA